jgi:hypothetical protein
MKTRKLCMLLTGLILLTVTPVLANSISVTADAAMGSSNSDNCGVPGTGCGLEVDFTGPQSSAYVQTNTLSNESAIRLRFIMDPGGQLSNPGQMNMQLGGNVRIVNFYTGFVVGGVNIVLFLKRGTAADSYRFACWVRQDNGVFTFGGESYLTGLNPTSATVVEFEWRAATAPGANNGLVRATRTEDRPGAPTATMFERTNLDNDTVRLNIMQMGSVVGTDYLTTEGVLYLDEVSIVRL